MNRLKRMSAGQLLLLSGLVSLSVFAAWVIFIVLLWMFSHGEQIIAWDLWAMLEGLSSAAAFAVVVGGGFFALMQLVEAVDNRHMAIYNDAFKRLMRDEEIRARRWIYQKLPDDPVQGIEGLSEIGQQHVKLVLNSFDHLGFLLMQNWVSDEAIIRWVSPIVVKTWAKLGPYVTYEAKRRGEPYYYEAARELAHRCNTWWAVNRPRSEIRWIDKAL